MSGSLVTVTRSGHEVIRGSFFVCAIPLVGGSKSAFAVGLPGIRTYTSFASQLRNSLTLESRGFKLIVY